jgi:hypothetical protein
MTLRIGFDVDGVLADLESALRDVERDLFGAVTTTGAGDPEGEEGLDTAASATAAKERESLWENQPRRAALWRRIRRTSDFWITLKPTDPSAVRRLHRLMLEYRWDVFFITQRPSTAGETAQRQTQRWLIQQGFDLPSVLVIHGSRGAAANALRLTHLVDDSAHNCLDVKSDSRAIPILIVPAGDVTTARQAEKCGIGVASSIGECLDVLERASAAPRKPGVLDQVTAMLARR